MKRLTKKEAEALIHKVETGGTGFVIDDYFAEGQRWAKYEYEDRSGRAKVAAFDFNPDNRGFIIQDVKSLETEIIPLRAMRALNGRLVDLYHITEAAQRKQERIKRNSKHGI